MCSSRRCRSTACAVSTNPIANSVRATIDLDAAWQLNPQVSIRPERFGALLYHFGTRRLSFLKSPTLLAVLRALDSEPSARAACRAAGVANENMSTYCVALTTLAASTMIRERTKA
jgi:putative mycofactocin binding protein MftB